MIIDWMRLVGYVVLGLVAVVLLAEVRPRLVRWADRRSWARLWVEPLVVAVAIVVLMTPSAGPYWFVGLAAGLTPIIAAGKSTFGAGMAEPCCQFAMAA